MTFQPILRKIREIARLPSIARETPLPVLTNAMLSLPQFLVSLSLELETAPSSEGAKYKDYSRLSPTTPFYACFSTFAGGRGRPALPKRETRFQTSTCSRRYTCGRTRIAPTTLYQSLYSPLLNAISTEALAERRNPPRKSAGSDTVYSIFDLICRRSRR